MRRRERRAFLISKLKKRGGRMKKRGAIESKKNPNEKKIRRKNANSHTQ